MKICASVVVRSHKVNRSARLGFHCLIILPDDSGKIIIRQLGSFMETYRRILA